MPLLMSKILYDKGGFGSPYKTNLPHLIEYSSPPLCTGICSNPPSGWLKPQKIPNSVYYVFTYAQVL
jgi:hypothetical protein